jgi:hypothetical protein
MTSRTGIDRVTFFNPDNTVFEAHSVPIGDNAKTYASDFVEREQRVGKPSRSYAIERDGGRMKGGTMAERSSEEVKKINISKMGEGLGEIYSALWQEVAVLHFDWHEYSELFGAKPERIVLMNDVAPHFFRLIQDRLWETTLLHLARLTDPAKSPGNDRTNLSIKGLADLITDATLKEEVSKLVDEAVRSTEFARDWRNRRIGHRDLKLALQQPTTPLADASREDVKKALTAVAAVLNALAAHYLHSYTAYDFGGPLGGTVSLLHVLGIGSRERAARGERLAAGKHTAQDLVIHDV